MKQDFYKQKISQINMNNKSFLDSQSMSKSRARRSIVNAGGSHHKIKSMTQLLEGGQKRGSLKLQVMQVDEKGRISPSHPLDGLVGP